MVSDETKYTEKIRFQAPRPVREALDRQVRATGLTRGEYLRSLIVHAALILPKPAPNQK